MKKILTILLFVCLLAKVSIAQTTYYVSNTGNDAANGTSESTALQTLSKINSFTFHPGDQILFKRGDVFVGEIIVNQSGTFGNPITFGAYGSGANPIITGFQTLTSWTANGGGVYYAPVPSNNTMIATWDGSVITIGRTPYYYYQSHSGNNQITSSDLSGTPNWTGANIVMRNERWIIDNFPVTAQSSGTVTFDNTSPLRGSTDSYAPKDGGWFFFQNDLRTLDTNGEWYSSAGKFYIYGNPSGHTIQASLQDYNINLQSNNYITIQDIDLTGASYAGIKFANNSHITVTGVNSTDQGGYFVFGENTCSSILIDNCTANNSLAGGIHLDNTQVNILNSTFNNTALSAGNHFSGDGFGGAIGLTGSQDTVKNCIIKNSGYEGIKVMGNNNLVSYNRIDSFCTVKTDGGGIYTSNSLYSNTKIDHNIVSNGIGSGTFDHFSADANGIYLDNGSRSGFVTNNTVFNVKDAAYYYQYDGYDWVMDGNTGYNFNEGVRIAGNDNLRAHNMTMTNNVIVATDATKSTLSAEYTSNNQKDSMFNVSDYNYFMRPIGNDGANIHLDSQYHVAALDYYYTLSQWQSLGHDSHSFGSPKFISSADSMILLFNPNVTDTSINLPYKYLGHDGTTYDGTITLAPFTSEVLTQDGSKTVAAPSVTTSGNQSITATSTNIFSTLAAASGHTITSVLWTQVSGTTATIGTPTSNNTNVSNLSNGESVFRITVTQDDGQTAYAEVSITVTIAAAPTANAGSDQVITLPTNQITLTGSGTVAPGQSPSYLWTKISGSGTQTISGNTTLSPTVSGLNTSGTYVFQLKVTQDDGQFAIDNVTITVNQAPVMNAGVDVYISVTPLIITNN